MSFRGTIKDDLAWGRADNRHNGVLAESESVGMASENEVAASRAEARRLLDHALGLQFQGEAAEEAARFAAVVSRFADSGDGEIEAVVADARYRVATLQDTIDREIQHYRALIARYPSAVEADSASVRSNSVDLDRVVAITMFQLAHALRENQQEQQAVREYRRLIERFSGASDAVIREQVEIATDNLATPVGFPRQGTAADVTGAVRKSRVGDAPFAIAFACMTPAIITGFVWLMAYLDVINGTHFVRDRGFTTSYTPAGDAVVLIDPNPLTVLTLVVGPAAAIVFVCYGIITRKRRRAAEVAPPT